ncbi:MFS transporter [Nonomuraea soli]|uniref:Putative MFS family arabinose efflux permease n=1 Tax=Nonomuraea soli TaxID=1032476 RepID=A0A7W0CKM2_9ACTN|nr:MFS transporter [Nonomuraea soli]MBA2892924.1 putative MFS family arabinose efflux permease [Nonomuraea soli]
MPGLSVRRFAGIWTAELVSVIGSSLTAFVLSVWVYQESGSETQFALNMLCATLPGLLITPFAGVIVDRFDRRAVLLLADAGAAAVTLVLAVLAHTGHLQVWHVYPATVVAAVCGTFHLTVYQAMTPLLVPERHLGRANGLLQTTFALQIAAPVLAGTLMEAVGLRGVFLLDLLSFAVVACVVASTRLPRSILRPAEHAVPPSFGADLTFGFARLRAGGLLPLVAAFAAFNFVFAVAGVLIRPLILSFATPATLGLLVFAGGAGLFAGSLVMGAWGGPRRKVAGAGVFMLLGSVALAGHALRPSVLLIAVVAPAFLFTIPIVNACLTTVLQSRTEAAAQGRVLASARTVSQLAVPLAYLIAAPLAEHVMAPALLPGGALAGVLGGVLGTGEGRGIALVFLADGVLLLVAGAATLLLPRLRRLDTTAPPTGHPAPALNR